MSKKQAITKKIGGLLAAVLVTMTILPVGQVNARAATVPVRDSGGKTVEVDFRLNSGTISGDIVYDCFLVESPLGYGKGVRVGVWFDTAEPLKRGTTGILSYTYEGRSYSESVEVEQAPNHSPFYHCGSSVHYVKDKVDKEDKEDKKEESHSSSKSEEPKGSFAPDTKTMTPEQKAGWSVVSREPVVLAPNTSYGMLVRNAYQGPMCRLAFQMTAPAGYALGHTYDYHIVYDAAGGNAGLKVPQDLMKTGRKYVVAFVVPGGPIVATAPLTPDEGGNINFNTNLLGLPAGSNYAMAIMYADV